MCDHTIRGTKFGGFGLVIAQQDFADFDEGEMFPVKGIESLLHLIERR